MAYIGRGLQWGEFSKQTIGSGTAAGPVFDGAATGPWTLDFQSNANSLLVVLDGQIQEPNVDFTVPTGTPDFSFVTAPTAGKNCYIIFLGQELTSMSNPSMADLQVAINISEANISIAAVDQSIAYSLALGSLG